MKKFGFLLLLLLTSPVWGEETAFVRTTAIPVARGGVGHMQLLNPAGSGKVFSVTKVYVHATAGKKDAQPTLVLLKTDVVLSNLWGRGISLRVIEDDSAIGEIRFEVASEDRLGGQLEAFTVPYTTHTKYILDPGQALMVRTGSPVADLRVTFEWVELP